MSLFLELELPKNIDILKIKYFNFLKMQDNFITLCSKMQELIHFITIMNNYFANHFSISLIILKFVKS